MEEKSSVKQRLEETVERCKKAYAEWEKDSKNIAAKQELEESVHELRKVTSRIEIELAISDRSNTNMKPMPIPPHRASQKPSQRKNNNRSNTNAKGGQGNKSDNGAEKNGKIELEPKATAKLDAQAAEASQNTGGETEKKPRAPRRAKLKTVEAKESGQE